MANFDEKLFNEIVQVAKSDPNYKPHKKASQEAFEYSVFIEYNALNKILEKQQDNYKLARFKILKFIINCVKFDPVDGDFEDENNNKLVQEAGQLLYNHSGMNGMHDPLVWSFIPKRFQRIIDYLWNGIGQWKA